MRRSIRRLVVDDAGQDLVEYGLLAAFIAVVSISVLTMLGPNIEKWFGVVESALQS